MTEHAPIPVLESTHHQTWRFSRYSYLEQPRPDHGLLLLLHGDMDYVNQETHLRVETMDLIYLPKGSRYEARIHPGTEDYLINFSFAREPEALPTLPCRVLRDGLHTLQPLMEQTDKLFRKGLYLAAMAQFLRFCHELTVALQPEKGDGALIRRAKMLLSQPDCPGLEEVARQLLVSPSGLRKKFREAEGISPAQYRMRQRVENARQLLLQTDLPVSKIAETCGFCDAAYFHKVFRGITGVTPTAYRSSRTPL